MALQRGAGAGQLRVLVRQLEQIGDDGPAGGAIVAEQHFGGTQMHLLDGGKPRQPDRLARDHGGQRQRRDRGAGQPDETEAFIARKEILDQMGNAQAEPEQHQSAQCGPEQRAPAETGSRGQHRRFQRHRQQRRVRFGRDPDGAAGEAPLFVGVHHHDAGVAELESRRAPMRRSLAHCSLSPIRN